jgi:hypothetical protein
MVWCSCFVLFLFARSVQECAQEIVAQLTMRAAAGGGAGSAGGALLQSQDDVSRVQALLLLQSDRCATHALLILAP